MQATDKMSNAKNQTIGWNMKKSIAVTLCGLMLLGGTTQAVAEQLQAEAIWLPEVEQMYQSDVSTPAWVTEPSEFVVVRGLADGGDESPRALVIQDVILPRLNKLGIKDWSPWEREIAEREIGRWLERSQRVVKRFQQPFYKVVDGERYEVFTREAWLLDLPETDMNALRHRIGRAVHTASQRKRTTIGMAIATVAALFCVCWIVFGVLDRLTRGYYIGWLRLAAAATFLVSAGLAIHVTQVILQNL